jgi:hypothetical protein
MTGSTEEPSSEVELSLRDTTPPREPDDADGGRPQLSLPWGGPRDRLAAVVLALILVTLIQGAVTWAFYTRMNEFADHVEEQQQVEYRTRAVLCREWVRDGNELTPNGPCLDPGVLTYFDPNTGEVTTGGSE